MDDYVTTENYPEDGFIEAGIEFPGAWSTDSIGITIRMNETKPRISDSFVQQLPDSTTDQTYQLSVSGTSRYFQMFAGGGLLVWQNFIESWIVGRLDGDVDGALNDSGIFFQEFPTPKYREDTFSLIVGSLLPLFFVLAFLYPFFNLSKGIILEKELRIKESLKMMGATTSSHFTAWFVTYLVTFIVLSFILTGLCFAGKIFVYSNFFIVFLAFFFFTMDIFALAWLTTSFFSKATSGGLQCAVIFLASFFGIFGFNATTTAPAKGIACLSAPICFGLGMQQLATFESAQQGINFSNAGVMENNFTMNTCIVLLFIDFFFYILMALYFERVFPSEWGVAEKPYFCFLPSYWCPKDEEQEVELREFDDRYETSELNFRVGLSVRNLEKRFGTQTPEEAAVKRINLDMFEGQIFALLGHNGAGKTTTINMLTGMLPPTSGDALIFGKNINTEMTQIRRDLGVCPQHDILFDLLTVREHLWLYAKIKGIPKDEIETAIQTAIEQVGLTEKVDTYSKNLSGGMKRKLSVGIALIGGSHTVILDEPTSGMDPYSRRSTWEMLKRAKLERVVILTTHFMDEADQLGDRIAIMHLGNIKCCGSSLFLKKKYGVGYILVIDREKEIKEQTDCVMKHVQGAKMLSSVAGEISFQLPFSESGKFADMFDEMERNKEKWMIHSYGISVTTLEEVFLKVGHDADEQVAEEAKRQVSDAMSRGERKMSMSHLDDDLKESVDSKKDYDDETAMGLDKPLMGDKTTGSHFRDLQGVERFLVHFEALMMKRWHSARRDYWIWIWQVVFPTIFLVAGIGILIVATKIPIQTVKVSTSEYNSPLYVPASPNASTLGLSSAFDSSSANFMQAYSPLGDGVHDSGCSFSSDPPTSIRNMSRYLLCTWKGQYEETKYGAFLEPTESSDDMTSIFVNLTATYAGPAYMNLLNKARARDAKFSNDNFDLNLELHAWPKTKKQDSINQAFSAVVITIAFAFVPAGVAGFVIMERQSGSKHLQVISGVSILAYWLSNFLWDFLNFFPSCLIQLAVYSIYDLDAFKDDALGVIFLGSLLFALAVIPFTYCMSFLFKSPATGQTVMLLIYFLSGTILLIVSIILNQIDSTADINKSLKFLYRLVPSYCFGEIVLNLQIRNIQATESDAKSGTAFDVIGWPCIYLTLEAITYFLILLVIEKVLATPDLYNRCFPAPTVTEDEPEDEDEDVLAERERVMAGKTLANTSGDEMQLLGLRKVYPGQQGPKVAVKNLWFGIPRGQCFGFLGINGAGKSTTLKMLTGDVLPTEGTAKLSGKDVMTDQEEVRKLIGYCPQFDALLPNMTARETLRMFAKFKGVPKSKMEPYLADMLKQLSLDINGWQDKPCGGYSGGNKRKLSVGIALVGDPPIVFLDEPSTGMDPGARRFMWDLISSTMATRSVILTTHSMEECEALCSRIGIMVGGRLRCLGSSQRLKSRYGSGHQLDMKVKKSSAPSVKRWVKDEFKGATIIEDQVEYIKFRIASASSLASVFRKIEESRVEKGIEEYSVSETTLEQIFLHFARQQEEEKGAVAGLTGIDSPHSPPVAMETSVGDVKVELKDPIHGDADDAEDEDDETTPMNS
uniref:ABC transporter domain-containing protein n=1 Tax=Lotharella globosa TaxID=91324 RepID=A0A7S3ZF35_9EUKA